MNRSTAAHGDGNAQRGFSLLYGQGGVGVSIVNPLTALDYADSGVVIRRFSRRGAVHRQFNPTTPPAGIRTG